MIFGRFQQKHKKKEGKRYSRQFRQWACGPLKNYHKGYLADPNGIRDTPLVPKGTVADIHIRTYMKYIGNYRKL